MNIQDYWPVQDPPAPTAETWAQMLKMREATFRGFATIEEKKGVIRPTVNLGTPHGQEVLRLLVFRCLEELGEAYLADNDDHYYEELIDAFNYLLSLFVIEKDSSFTQDKLFPHLALLSRVFGARKQRMNLAYIGQITVDLGGRLGDYLRNRPWMHNAQSTYFDGDLVQLLENPIAYFFQLFPSFGTFWKYYVAKDAVLQFRLRSQY